MGDKGLTKKNGAKEQNGFRKGSDCAAAQAANVHNYKHNQRLADVSAVSQSRFCDGEPVFLGRGNFINPR